MDIVAIIISVITSVTSGMLLFALQSKIKENKSLKREKEELQGSHKKAIEDGVVCLLRRDLMEDHKEYVTKGYISSKALESGLLMYKAYKALGGNGMIDHMEEEIQELPIRD